MRLHHLSAAFLFFSLPVTVLSQPGPAEIKGARGEAPCRVIRRLGYPFGKRVDLVREVRYALLNTCPDRRQPAARPMLEVTVNGEKRLGEFEVARFFKDRRAAEVYARQNNIDDFKTELDDYSVWPQMRPVISYLKALETSDFELYRSAFDYDWEQHRPQSAVDWDALRKRETDRLRKRLGGDYSSAELDFRFIPSGESGRSGRIDLIHKGRTLTNFQQVVFVEGAGGWRLVMRPGRGRSL